MKTELRHVTPKDPADWSLYHAIRKSVLWDGGSRYYYRADNPDETAEGNFPMIFFAGDKPVGVVRIDLKKKTRQAFLRRMAIVIPEREKGYGTMLMLAAEEFARQRGCDTFITHAPPEVIPFYENLGYELHPDPLDKDLENPRLLKNATKGNQKPPRPSKPERTRPEPPLKLPKLVFNATPPVRTSWEPRE